MDKTHKERKVYKCSKCDYQTFHGRSMDRHFYSYVHGESKPLTCICNRGFVREFELQNHIKTECKLKNELKDFLLN